MKVRSLLQILLYACWATLNAGGQGRSATADWQWSAEVKGGREQAGPARAFLWIPPDCRQVRAVVVAQNNMEEESILENPRFRKAMGRLGFAEIWVSPPFDHLFRFNEGAGETFNNMVEDLAARSGYEELKYAPVIAMGHSAAASWPYYFAAWAPGRTLAAISVSGQWPYFRSPVFAPDIWGDRTIDSIPCLETMGEYEAASTWSEEGLKERAQHPLMALSMLANPGQGHFAATDAKVDYLALYIKKAAQYRLPAQAAPDAASPHNPSLHAPPHLRPIDPSHTGWLVDRWRPDSAARAQPAPVGKYKGDPAQAFWFFDEEMARTTERYEAAYRGKKADLLGYLQDGKIVPQRNTHQQVDLKFEPGPDGIGFRLRTCFLDTVPGASPRTAAWTGLPVGAPVGHADNAALITIDRITGPFRQLGPDSFAISLEKGLSDRGQSYQLWFAATHPGDASYRPAVQQAEMVIPARNTEGADQHIDFPVIPDQQAGAARSLTLHAVSDAGAPVSYYVLEGPATVDGDTLLLTGIPPRSRYPIKVTVVAWQYGHSTAPQLKTAEPVTRTFLIRK